MRNKNRKGFTLNMLEDRWALLRQEVIDLLEKYHVPGYLTYSHIHVLNKMPDSLPVDYALFFEEYINDIETYEEMIPRAIDPITIKQHKENVK